MYDESVPAFCLVACSFVFLNMIFLTLGHAANTEAGQTRTPLETVGFAGTLRS